jgi:hypothetical protein
LQLTKGLDEIRKDKSIALLGAMQALFEGAMYTCMRVCYRSPASAVILTMLASVQSNREVRPIWRGRIISPRSKLPITHIWCTEEMERYFGSADFNPNDYFSM